MTIPAAGNGIAIGVDVGGTKLAAGLVAADGSVLDRVRYDTPSGGEQIVDLIAEIATSFTGAHKLASCAVGVGAAGLITLDGDVRFAPNIDWSDFGLGTELRKRLDGPVTVDNDANAAAWGEFRLGAGRDATHSMVMLTIGTGVGGGLVLGGQLVRGAGGMAGELGHIAVLEGGPRCPCGSLGCLEALASGTAIARFAHDAHAGGRLTGALADVPLDKLTGKAVTVAAHAGDAQAVEILATAGRWLGVGIASLIAAFDPEVIVVGGGAMQAGHLLLGPAIAAAQDRLLGRGHRDLAPIMQATLADDAGLVGAALLAMEPTPR